MSIALSYKCSILFTLADHSRDAIKMVLLSAELNAVVTVFDETSP